MERCGGRKAPGESADRRTGYSVFDPWTICGEAAAATAARSSRCLRRGYAKGIEDLAGVIEYRR